MQSDIIYLVYALLISVHRVYMANHVGHDGVTWHGNWGTLALYVFTYSITGFPGQARE